jgi:hypothetical protein
MKIVRMIFEITFRREAALARSGGRMTHRRIVIRRYARPCVPFPLTPALSSGERENRFQSARTIDALGLAVRRDAGLPLSKGEGRGEG